MNTSYTWIKKYVPDLDVTPQEYTDAMTMTGTKVEGFTRLDADIDRIIVGKVTEIAPHPNADKLVVCQVDVGSDTVQIVTGAPNVFEGAIVPVVLDGGKVAGGHDGTRTPGGVTIKAGSLRGVPSYGMMCSIEELGSTKEMYPEAPDNGIYIFPEDTPVGGSAIEALGLNDTVFEYEITSNRVDCYSVIGIAREAAATFGKQFCPPVVTPTGNDEDVNDYISVEVKDAVLCPRFCGRVVKNVKLGPSPKWMQRCLAASGIRPINNLVDITNYVMEEYGQPMHAYDLDTIAGRKIIVKRASDGEAFISLDGKKHILDKDVLTICDAEKAIGIAGIMGGENTMITEAVKTVFFECANFDGTNNRLSAKRLGMRTDASGKFEKGLDPNNCEEAINRACQLMEEMGAGEVVGGLIDLYPEKRTEVKVPFDPEAINSLLGTDLSAEEMISILAKVELVYDKADNSIVAPTFRQDIHNTADIAEEVARFFGYDNIPVTLPRGESTTGRIPFDIRVRNVAGDVAEFCGFSQGMHYSFESPKVFDKLRLSADSPLRKAIRIQNPLGEDFSIMRTVTLGGMLTSLSYNYSHRNKDVRLYEIGNVYLADELPLKELPREVSIFTLGMYGKGDFFELKGVIEEFLEKAGLKERPEYSVTELKPFLHPGRQSDITYKGETVGWLGQVHPAVCGNFDIGTTVYAAAIDMSVVTRFASFDYKYTGIARFPAVTRDISMIVPTEIPAASIEKIIRQRGGKILESLELFDIYEGSQIGDGFKSMAYKMVFRSKEKTLEEMEVSATMKKILNGLESMHIQLRQ